MKDTHWILKHLSSGLGALRFHQILPVRLIRALHVGEYGKGVNLRIELLAGDGAKVILGDESDRFGLVLDGDLLGAGARHVVQRG